MSDELKVLELWPLENEYALARVERFPKDDYDALFREHMLSGHPILPWRSSLDDDERAKIEALAARVKGKYELRIALLHRGKLIGWTYGWQDSGNMGDFYMANSLVLPEHRGIGLYTAMVEKVLELTTAE